MKDYQVVEYNSKKYAVCRYIKKDGTNKLFIIDAEDLSKISSQGFALYEINGYIGYCHKIDSKKTAYYLHNIVMDKAVGGGKGQQYTIDHRNRITHDNRKANLKLLSQSEQNENRKRQERTATLPKKCGFTLDDIPKYAYYRGPQPDGHGNMFVIELQHGGKCETWQTSSSNKTPLIDKLAQCIKTLIDIEKTYPELVENKNLTANYSDDQLKLMKEFNEIISLTSYTCVKDNLIKIPKKITISYDIPGVSKDWKEYLDTTNCAIKNGKSHKPSLLPKDCGITPDMVPKYCYYKPESDKRGDCFIIDKHPNFPAGKRQWGTSSSKKITTQEKFDQMIKVLDNLKKSPGNTNFMNGLNGKQAAISSSKPKYSNSGSKSSKKSKPTPAKKAASKPKYSNSGSKSSKEPKLAPTKKAASTGKVPTKITKLTNKVDTTPAKKVIDTPKSITKTAKPVDKVQDKQISGSKSNKSKVEDKQVSGSKSNKSKVEDKQISGSKSNKSKVENKQVSGSKINKSVTKISNVPTKKITNKPVNKLADVKIKNKTIVEV